MLKVKNLPFKPTYLQVNLISFLLAVAFMIGFLVIMIGYPGKLALLAVAGIGGLALAWVVFSRPHIGSYLLAVTVYTNASTILTTQGLPGINKPLIAVVLLGFLANCFVYRKTLTPFRSVEWFLLAYGAVWLMSSFVAKDQARSIELVVDYAKDFVLILCLIYPLENRPESWKRTIWLIIIVAGILASLGTYQALTNNYDVTFLGFAKSNLAQIVEGEDDAERITGPIDDPNFFAQALIAVLPLALYRLLDEKDRLLKLIAGTSSLVIAIAVLYTYSRGAFLAMMLILLLIALERRVNISLIIIVTISMFALTSLMPSGFTDRLSMLSIFTNSDDNSVQSEVSFTGRTSEMISARLMFSAHPFLGVGVGNYSVNYQDYAQRLGLEYRTGIRKAHSLYLEVAAETGIFGILTLGGLVGSLLIGLQQARRKLRGLADYAHWASWIVSLQVSVVAYLTTSIFLHGDYLRYLWLIVAFGATMIRLADYLVAQEKTETMALGKRSLA